MRQYTLWINNEWCDASSNEWLSVTDPATEETIGLVPAATKEDVDRAVRAAKSAFAGWRDLSPDTRVDLLLEVARRLATAAPELASTLTLETGRLEARNRFYIEWSSRVFGYYAELARSECGRVVPSATPGEQLNFTLKVPYGVVGCIVPWNYPILLLAWKLAPALAAGNTVVIKPASQTPLTTLEMMKAAFDHLPPGVVNVITGRGAETGDTLVRHPDVPLIAFTGSTEVGQHLMRLAVPQVKKLHLELGGKDPAIVCADAPLDRTVQAITWGGFLNAGQVCTSIERVYVETPLYEDFVSRLGQAARSLNVGSGFDPAAQVTPMISEAARAGVHALVQDAIAKGARLVAGGEIPAGLERGFFYAPTVLADCNHAMRIMTEETFGPVVAVMPVSSLDEAITLANDSDYGLGASVFTESARAAQRVFSEVEAGTVWINDPLVDNVAGPFGGMKQSGIGRELGHEGLEAFRQVKHVHWDIGGRPKGWWFDI